MPNVTVRTNMSPSIALGMVAKATFREFTLQDWMAFSGCTTLTPKYGECGDFIIVVDGDVVNIIHHQDPYGGQTFFLTNY